MIDSHVQFEKFCSIKGLAPVGKHELPGGEVCVAECFVTPAEAQKIYDYKLGLQVPKSVEYPAGYYQTFWCVMRGKADIGQWLEFDADHDPELNGHAKKQARFNTAVRVAEDFIKKSLEVGRYGG